MSEISGRKKEILDIIIKEHIKTGAPVGSGIVVNKYKLNLSSATVRNEMAFLEKAGLIIQPYTSAGRVPTEKAYQLYLKSLKKKNLKELEKKAIDEIFKDDSDDKFKNLAKMLAKFSNNAVFWVKHKNNLYYTGISNFLQQPEFTQMNLIYNISGIIDRLDEIIIDVFDDIQEGVQVFIGEKNPFSNFCGTIITKYKIRKKSGLVGILGPMRMDYEKNLALMDYLSSKLKN